jgi:DNA-binding winged helix-turn-helix (wHTH) protein
VNAPPDDGLIRVEESEFRAWKGSELLQLPNLVFRILAVLARQPGKLVTKRELIREVWHTDWMGPDKSLAMHLSHLRRLLGDDPANPRYITTIRGVGFRLEASAVPALPPLASDVEAFRLPLRIDRHGQTIYDANDVLVAAAMSPRAAAWIVECANDAIVPAEVVSRG